MHVNDKDQNEKLQEIIDLLVAAGYFRARIKTLSPFDKIIGGMTWAIQSSNQDIDIDLFFQDSLSIGHKIALTESIVKALISMNCPFRIEPHQIQGLDCTNILPVIQWLIRTSIEVRQIAASINYQIAFRSYRRLNLSNRITCDNSEKHNSQKSNFFRNYRYKGQSESLSVERRCKVVLFEYGIVSTANYSVSNSGDEKNLHVFAKTQLFIQEQTDIDEKSFDNEEENVNDYQPLDSSQYSDPQILSKAILKSLNSDKSDVNKGNKWTKLDQCEFDLKRKVETLAQEVDQLQQELERDQVDEKIVKLKASLELAEAKIVELSKEFNSMSQDDQLERKSLATNIIEAKKQKEEFKQKCRQQKEEFELKLNKLRDDYKSIVDANQSSETYEQLAHQIHEKRSLLDQLDLEALRVNQKVLELRRRLDDLPSRSELNQYQRRFIELFQLITTKNNEIKKLYSLYNELQDTRSLLIKEISLLESILDNLSMVSGSLNNKIQFLDQFQSIVDGILKVKFDILARLKLEREKCDQLNLQYSKVIDSQRDYYKALREFKDQCILNENLRSKIAALNAEKQDTNENIARE